MTTDNASDIPATDALGVPSTEKTNDAKKRTRNAQDIRIANQIAEARTLLNRIKTDRTLTVKCSARGFEQEKFDFGLSLVDNVQSKFNFRQQFIGEQHTEVATLKIDQQDTSEGFFELRECARIGFPDDPGMRAALGASGKIPADGERFQTAVRAALAVAMQSPQKEKLAQFGFTDEKHAALTAKVDRLERQRQVVESVKERAQKATLSRDEAFAELRAFLAPLLRVLKLIERIG